MTIAPSDLSLWLFPLITISGTSIIFLSLLICNSSTTQTLLLLSQTSSLFPPGCPSLALSSHPVYPDQPKSLLPQAVHSTCPHPCSWTSRVKPMTLSAFFPLSASFPSTNPILFTFYSFHCFLLPAKALLLFYTFLPSYLNTDHERTDCTLYYTTSTRLGILHKLERSSLPSPSSNIAFVFKMVQDHHPNNSPICFFPQVPQNIRTYTLP